jgi:hypothetical protein
MSRNYRGHGQPGNHHHDRGYPPRNGNENENKSLVYSPTPAYPAFPVHKNWPLGNRLGRSTHSGHEITFKDWSQERIDAFLRELSEAKEPFPRPDGYPEAQWRNLIEQGPIAIMTFLYNWHLHHGDSLIQYEKGLGKKDAAKLHRWFNLMKNNEHLLLDMTKCPPEKVAQHISAQGGHYSAGGYGSRAFKEVVDDREEFISP